MFRFSDKMQGFRFSRLKVIKRADNIGISRVWFCLCDCGVEIKARENNLKSGQTKSCGCIRKKHGMSGTREYRTWRAMIARCTNSNLKGYKYYGGRGIKVCDRWKGSFENFYKDMGDRPENTTIDRQDNDGNYEPGNCRWATPREQVMNRRNTIR